MKTLNIFFALIVISVTAKAQFIKAELQVSGLTCSMCSKATEKSLHTLNFIGDIKADLNRNVFIITFRKDADVNLNLISKKVQDAGFFVNNLKTTINLDNIKLSNNSFNNAGATFNLINADNRSLNGPVAFTVVDKGFAPVSVLKKYKTGIETHPGPGNA